MPSLPWFTISLFLFSFNFATSSSAPLCHPDEKLILLQFRNSLATNVTGPMNEFCPYPVEIISSRSSTTGDDCCQWEWINCDPSTAHVVNIDLHCSGLNGSIESIGTLFKLRQLQSVILSSNYLTGELPLTLHNSMRLSDLWELNLASNSLYGPVPSWITSLPSLQTLYLSGNRFTGSLVDVMGNPSNSLQELGLDDNEFYGSIPESIFFNFPNLTLLDLSSNDLNGTVELADIFSNLKYLESLDLSDNNLSIISTTSANFKSVSMWPNMSYLGLSSCNLNEFPFLGFVDNLVGLNLSKNSIRGDIPEWLHDMAKSVIPPYDSMWLDLSKNSLVGGLEHLPWERLLSIDISSNSFQGPLPISSINPQLTSLLASNNKLNGTLNQSICNLNMLQVLDLSNNTFSGEIPKCLENTSPSLSVLNLRSNRLGGSIPQNFSECDQLVDLDLSNNRLGGAIPPSLIRCTNLQVLNLANNKLDDVFPSWLDALPYLQVLNLHSNKLHGHVTSTKAEHPFPKLQILDLSSNNFNGELPTRYIKGLKAMMNITQNPGDAQYLGSSSSGYFSVQLTFKSNILTYVKIITTMAFFDVSNNGLEGEIPDSIGGLVSLRGLNLSHNHLTGQIPASMGNLALLDFLDLSSNRLTGQIPEELVSLTFLGVFNVSANQLEGVIPHGRNFETFSANSYQGNPRLCGYPLSECNEGGKSRSGSSEGEVKDEDNEDGSTLKEWEIILMGYGCGAFLGLVWGCYMLSVGKPLWFANFANTMALAISGFCDSRLGRRGRRAKINN
uniref:Leucine-rich repeat-containing N-terminal plant-type domain-containing protein n=2 Tax=Opuntia streptacantha TaxID=393608 RepID=A0A7C9CT53_OPUST